MKVSGRRGASEFDMMRRARTDGCKKCRGVQKVSRRCKKCRGKNAGERAIVYYRMATMDTTLSRDAPYEK